MQKVFDGVFYSPSKLLVTYYVMNVGVQLPNGVIEVKNTAWQKATWQGVMF